ncbi:MAG: hypothetical protein ACOY3P_10435 [Planctomycetota bacterium]
MIRVTCASCGSKLDAKEKLLGQVRKCPKCGQPVRIERAATKPDDTGQGRAEESFRAEGSPRPEVPDFTPEGRPREGADGNSDVEALEQANEPAGQSAGPDGVAAGTSAAPLPVERVLNKLDRDAYYVILGPAGVVATWESNGRGWMVRTGNAPLPARRAEESLPPEGDFRLVELVLATSEAGSRLAGVHIYQLARRWALRALARGDDAIAEKVIGRVGLTQQQKVVVRGAIRDRFMPEVWQGASHVHAYLASNDTLSPGTDEAEGGDPSESVADTPADDGDLVQ